MQAWSTPCVVIVVYTMRVVTASEWKTLANVEYFYAEDIESVLKS